MNQGSIKPKKHKTKMIKRRARKHIIKGQTNTNKNRKKRRIPNSLHFKESDTVEQELSDIMESNKNPKRMNENNHRNSSSSSNNYEKSPELNIANAKSKSGFFRNHRQEQGLIWIDHQSSSDSN